ncbi:hypothetical protein [Methylobacterium sp. PvR107]|uniref:hypothetical protein n=1 Tax=Methylobacterium sp. PvR107 TaxID=2806597 RepID=UPI001AEAADAA|nr:hypothetical protein [Methylobacterium sp. PvR107]MBP1180908.1 DNA-binding MarR family transcriptional regulator [Methylobacterium sp. PvR107]
MTAILEEEPKARVAALRRANEVLRAETGVMDLSASWVQVLLCVAEQEAQPLSAIERASGLRTSSAQRILLGLGRTDRFGKPGLNLIEDIVDPRHGTRKLYFLSDKGRTLLTKVAKACGWTGSGNYPARTGSEFLERFAAEQRSTPAYVDTMAFSPQEIATGKRSLSRRKPDGIGTHIVAFPLAPALSVIGEIKEWLDEHGGELHELKSVAKPTGMAIVDLPSAKDEVHFRLRWHG